MRNRTRKTTKTKTPLREGEHGTAERAEAERANSAAGAWAERGPAAFVEAAAGAEGQDALTISRTRRAVCGCLRPGQETRQSGGAPGAEC